MTLFPLLDRSLKCNLCCLSKDATSLGRPMRDARTQAVAPHPGPLPVLESYLSRPASNATTSPRMRADAPALLAFLTLTSSPGPGQSSTCHAFQISDWEHSYGQARPSRSCALPCSKRYTPPSQQPRQRAWFGNAARDFHWTGKGRKVLQ